MKTSFRRSRSRSRGRRKSYGNVPSSNRNSGVPRCITVYHYQYQDQHQQQHNEESTTRVEHESSLLGTKGAEQKTMKPRSNRESKAESAKIGMTHAELLRESLIHESMIAIERRRQQSARMMSDHKGEEKHKIEDGENYRDSGKDTSVATTAVTTAATSPLSSPSPSPDSQHKKRIQQDKPRAEHEPLACDQRSTNERDSNSNSNANANATRSSNNLWKAFRRRSRSKDPTQSCSATSPSETASSSGELHRGGDISGELSQQQQQQQQQPSSSVSGSACPHRSRASRRWSRMVSNGVLLHSDDFNAAENQQPQPQDQNRNQKQPETLVLLRQQLLEESMMLIKRRREQARRQRKTRESCPSLGDGNGGQQHESVADAAFRESISLRSSRSSVAAFPTCGESPSYPGDGSGTRSASEQRGGPSERAILVAEPVAEPVADPVAVASTLPQGEECGHPCPAQKEKNEAGDHHGWRGLVRNILRSSRSKSRSRPEPLDGERERRSRSKSRSSWTTKPASTTPSGPATIRSRSQDPAPSNNRMATTIRMRSNSECRSEKRPVSSKSKGRPAPFVNDDGGEEKLQWQWHSTIAKHDWKAIRTMLLSHDHTQYRRPSSHKSSKKSKKQQQQHHHSLEASPLLRVDAKGRTPLHWACTEHMPSNLLRRLLFVERCAASVADEDGRLPLHLAVMNGLDQHVLDRMIRANPDALGTPDRLRHTPLRYAVLKADRSRPKNAATTAWNWGAPITQQQALDQANRETAFENVLFLLETMVSRRKGLAVKHETNLPTLALESFAPPPVVGLMTVLGEKILKQDRDDDGDMSERLFEGVFRANYPLTAVHKVVETISKCIPEARLLVLMRKQLANHYNEGCTDRHPIGQSNGVQHQNQNQQQNENENQNQQHASASLAKEFARRYRNGSETDGGGGGGADDGDDEDDKLSLACHEWWDKLRYLIAKSSNRSTGCGKNESLLHLALANPTSQPSLIEYICRLNPTARYKIDATTGALPIHIACQHWHPERHRVGTENSRIKVLNLLLAGDFDLVRRRCNSGNIALHCAISSGKSLRYIQSILNLDRDTLSIPDPATGLLPFQLAALAESYDRESHAGTPVSRSPRVDSKAPPPTPKSASTSTHQTDVIYHLLRTKPSVLSALSPNTNPE